MSLSRQLAAIMFTDIVGYTQLMQKSELGAIQIRNRHREVLNLLHINHQGRLIQYYGDGTLSIFDSAVNAVMCAIEIQRLLKKDPEVPLRIGIHLGDILLTDTDIIGDSVNIASRVESLGTAGAILISHEVMKEIKNQNHNSFQLLGDFHFKNDSTSRKIYAISAPGIVVPLPNQLSGKLKPLSDKKGIESLAVLPLDNLTGQKNKEFMVAGIHDNLITALSRISSLRVISKTSTLSYKNTRKSIPEVARELNVDAVIEGSVSSNDSNIYLNLQLIRAFPEEDHIWADVFDRPMHDIFPLLNEITQAISERIDMYLTPRESERFNYSKKVDGEAYKTYLRGMFHLERLVPEDFRIGKEYMEKAISIDPSFVEPYTAMAFSIMAEVQMGMVPPAEGMPKLYQLMGKIADLNQDSAEAHNIRAGIYSFVEWDWKKGETEFLRAIDMNPNNSTAHAYYGHVLMLTKRYDEAIAQVTTAMTIDPNNSLVLALAAVVFYASGEFQRSIELAKASYKIDPKSLLVLRILDMCYYKLGEFDESIQMQKKLQYDDPESLKALEEGYKNKNYKKAMLELALMKEKLRDQQYVQPGWVAIIYNRAGIYEKAIKWLEHGLQIHDQDMPYIFIMHEFEKLKQDERFPRFAQKIGVSL